MIDQVLGFNKKFGLPDGSEDELLTQDIQISRTGFIKEELDELVTALYQNDKAQAFEALLDLAYVIHGTALFMGISPSMWKILTSLPTEAR